MPYLNDPSQTISRLREGFERIAYVLRADLWAVAGGQGLNPIQAQVLGLLAARPAGLRPKDIAAHLGVSAASMADTLAVLTRKGLMTRGPDARDARAAIIRLTAEGRSMGVSLSRAASQVSAALAHLSKEQRTNLLRGQIALIRELQIAGAIPVQRMCVNCRHFRPNIHSDAENLHHCAFVDAAFGNGDLRLDCGDHEIADPALQSANWMAFEKGAAPLQAQT